MLERLGKVLGWAGNIFAALFLIGSVFGPDFYLRNDHISASEPRLFIWFPLVGCVIAFAIFLIGRAFRYIFVG